MDTDKNIWNPEPTWFQDMKTQYQILNYKLHNDSLTQEERDTHKYLESIIHDIKNLLETIRTFKEEIEQREV